MIPSLIGSTSVVSVFPDVITNAHFDAEFNPSFSPRKLLSAVRGLYFVYFLPLLLFDLSGIRGNHEKNVASTNLDGGWMFGKQMTELGFL